MQSTRSTAWVLLPLNALDYKDASVSILRSGFFLGNQNYHRRVIAHHGFLRGL